MTRLLLASLATFWCAAALAAPTPAPVRAEIDALMARLQSSGCEFNRNGAWHGGAQAREHLLRKLDHIEGKTTLRSSEQFIDLAASRSSLSGKAYQVRCPGQPAVESQAWLLQQLKALRQPAGKVSG